MDTAEPTTWPSFEDWWNLYENKVDRRKCEAKWNKLKQADKEKAMEHTKRYVATTFTDGTFPSRRNPLTYINNHNWNDEALIRTAAVTKAGSDNPGAYAYDAADALARKLDRQG